MDLPSKCNSSLSATDPACAISSPNHRGICPVGFHVPTNAEWDALYRLVGGDEGMSDFCKSTTAGSKLKAESGWNNCGPDKDYDPNNNYLCEDKFGFSALPGGTIAAEGFKRVGAVGFWWSASEGSGSKAYYQFMSSSYNYAQCFPDNKSYGFSVRCVKD